MAFLIGGLAINANAQEKATSKNNAKVENTAQKVDYDQMLKDFETNINNYITAYDKFLKGDKSVKADFTTYQKKAQDLQAKLEKSKDKMNKDQINIFLQRKEKFANALKRKK